MDDKTSSPEERTGNRHLSRRRVLKTAAHAAWVVPAIQVVSMAPAFAMMSGDGDLEVTATGEWTLGSTDSMLVSIDVTNSDSTRTAQNLALNVTFPQYYMGGSRSIKISGVPSEWTCAEGAGPITGTGTPKSAVVHFLSGITIGPGITMNSVLTFTVTPSRNVTSGAVTNGRSAASVDASAGGGFAVSGIAIVQIVA